MALHWIDYIILGLISLSVITGLFRGFVKELLALCVWVLAIWLAFTYSHVVSLWLEHYIHDKTARIIVSFIVILLLTLILGGMVNAFFSFIMQRSGLNGTDRILGMGFGFVRGIFIVAIIMVAVRITGVHEQEYTKQSALYSKFDPFVNWLWKLTPKISQDRDPKSFQSSESSISVE